MVQQAAYVETDLEGQDPGGFVVLNVDAPMVNPYQVLDDDHGAYFRTLEAAREACQRFREESGNEEIYIYALMGVTEALTHRPTAFLLEHD